MLVLVTNHFHQLSKPTVSIVCTFTIKHETPLAALLLLSELLYQVMTEKVDRSSCFWIVCELGCSQQEEFDFL